MSPSACSFSGQITLTLIQFEKDPHENKVSAKLKIEPSLKALKSLNFSECLTPNFPVTSSEIVYSPDSSEISFIFTYNQSLNTKDLQVTFDPPDNLEFFYTNSTKLGMPPNTDNNLVLKAYPDIVYEQVDNLEIVAQVLVYFAIAVFIFGFIFSSKLIGTQMIEIVQLGYLGLIIIDRLEALLYPFIQLWPINGYNLIFKNQLSINTPSRVYTPGYQSQFLANFSLNFIFAVLPLIIGIILFIVAKTCMKPPQKEIQEYNEETQKNKKLKRLSFRILKQWQLTGLLIIQFHLTASFILAILYGTEIAGIAGGVILLIDLLILGVLLWKRPLNFGQYKRFFRNQKKIYLNFYIWVILWRIGFVCGLAALNEVEACGYFSIGFTSLQFLVIVVLRPYKYNFRPIVNSILMIIISIIYTIYRINITDEVDWLPTYLPIILLSLLFFAVIFNLIFMLLYFKKKCFSEQKQKSHKQIQAIELQMDMMTKREIKEQHRITSPIGAQNFDNPNTNLLKNLKLMSSLKPISINKDKSYMKEYDAI